MKIVSWAQMNDMVVTAGETIQFTLNVVADGGKDLHLAYLVLMGHDDVKDLNMEGDILPRIVARLVEENEELRKQVTRIADLERVIQDQAATLAEISNR